MTRPIQPGEILADELLDPGISAPELARQIAVPPNRISQIIYGKCASTGDTALRLGHGSGMNPLFWLNLRAAHELARPRLAAGRAIDAMPGRPFAAQMGRLSHAP